QWTRTRHPSALWGGEDIARLTQLEPAPDAEHRNRLQRWLSALVSTRYPIERSPQHTFTLAERRFIVASLRARLRRRLLALGVVAATITALAIAATITYHQRNRARDSA